MGYGLVIMIGKQNCKQSKPYLNKTVLELDLKVANLVYVSFTPIKNNMFSGVQCLSSF